MRHSPLICVIVLAALVAIVGCNRSTEDPKERLHDVQGKVVAVDAQAKKVTLDHEDVPGVMKGMTMPFAVSDWQLIADLKPGDQVRGRLKVKDGAFTIVELKKQ